MQKKILITGASGFIGSTAVDKALELGYETWAGIRSGSSRKFLQDSRLNFIDLNFSDKDKLAEQLRAFTAEHGKFDYIAHIAGITKAVRKEDFERVNFGQTKNFIDALIESDSVPQVFVFMSSLSAWGAGDEKQYRPISFDQIPSPDTAYGKSKLMAENYLKSIPDFPYVILRPTGVYGPRDKDYLILMRAVKKGIDVGAGFKKQLLTFIYSEDLAKVIFACMDKGIYRREYFVADGDVYTDSEFNRIVKEALHKKVVIRLKVPLWIVKPAAYLSEKIASMQGRATTFNTDKYRIMKQRNWTCDITPLQRELDFVPDFRLKEGVEKTIAWYKNEGWL